MRDSNSITMASSVHTWSDARIYSKEAKSLVKFGKNIQFIAIDSKVPKESIPGLNMVYLTKKNRLLRFFHWGTIYHLMLSSDSKYFHFHDPELLLVAFFLRRKLKKEITIIYDMHEHFPAAIKTKEWLPRWSRKVMARLLTKLEKKLMTYCDVVLFAEESYKVNYQECTLIKEDIYNYPLIPSFQRLKNRKDNEVRLVYAGALTEQRGLFNMLELMSHLQKKSINKYHLYLVGDMHTKENRAIKFIEQHDLNKVVHILGRRKYEELWELYAQSDIGLCLLHPTPNNVNSKSTKIFEYMASSLPIIASNFSSYKFIVDNQCGYIQEHTDYEAIMKNIESITEDRELAYQLGTNGRNQYEKNYSWEHEAMKLLSIYENRGISN